MELVLVAVFTWNVADPLYFLTMNRMMPDGFDRDSVYVLSLKHKERDVTALSEDIVSKRWEQMNRILQNHPDIDLAVAANSENIYGTGGLVSRWMVTDSMLADSSFHHAESQILEYNAVENADMIRLYGFEVLSFKCEGSSNTSRLNPHTSHFDREIWLSRTLAMQLYGRTDVVGERLRITDAPVVAGVFNDVRPGRYTQPRPLALMCRPGEPARKGLSLHWPCFIIRLKPGADAARLLDDIQPEAEQLGFKAPTLRTLTEVATQNWFESEERNMVRMMRLLCSFGLACVLLGMLGTFWVRCAARRGDIAVMRALGASRWRVMCHFLGEATLLVTFSSLVAAPIVAVQVYMLGVYGIDGDVCAIYPQNVLATHCLHVALLTYLFLLAVSLLGALIPVAMAVQELPAEGLKEE